MRTNQAGFKPRVDLLITGAAEILTCVPSHDDILGRISGGAISIADERIIAVGTSHDIARQVDASAAQVIDAAGKIVAPGFVDSHTHLVFGGSRVREYAARMTHSLEQVKAMGIPTGIMATVESTRAESVEMLTVSAAERLQKMFRFGTTTVESKSGYGLTVLDEMKMLQVNRRLKATQPVDIVSTFLGAHAFPTEISRERYVEMIVNEMIPQVAAEALAEFCDVFCDEGYFSLDEARRILEAGRAVGLKLKTHADQYSSIGASEMAAEIGAISADHLNFTPRDSMQRLAKAGVVGVVTPVLDFAVQHPRPFDARAMLAEGMSVALATDLCPACWVESMQLVMALACRLYRFSPAEALYAATVGGAKALGLLDRGSLEPGKLADIQIWDSATFEDVIYRIGNNAVSMIIKRGTAYRFI